MLGWLGLAFGITGSILNAHKNFWSWVLWIVANICIIIYSFTLTPIAWPIIINNVIFFGINIYGIWKWKTKPDAA